MHLILLLQVLFGGTSAVKAFSWSGKQSTRSNTQHLENTGEYPPLMSQLRSSKHPYEHLQTMIFGTLESFLLFLTIMVNIC